MGLPPLVKQEQHIPTYKMSRCTTVRSIADILGHDKQGSYSSTSSDKLHTVCQKPKKRFVVEQTSIVSYLPPPTDVLLTVCRKASSYSSKGFTKTTATQRSFGDGRCVEYRRITEAPASANFPICAPVENGKFFPCDVFALRWEKTMTRPRLRGPIFPGPFLYLL